jgi:hypothetical protein
MLGGGYDSDADNVESPSTSSSAAPADTGRAVAALPASAVCSCAFTPHAPLWVSFNLMPPAGTSEGPPAPGGRESPGGCPPSRPPYAPPAAG